MNKKGKADETGKKRTRKTQKFQKAIVGMSLEDIKKKKAEKPQIRAAAKEAAVKEAKARMQQKSSAKPKAAGGAAKAQAKTKGKMDNKSKGGAAPKAFVKGKR